MNKDFYRLSFEAFRHGVRAANPGKCLKEAIKEKPIPTPNGGKYIVISIGKAASSLMEAAIDILPPKRAFLMGNAIVIGIVEKLGKELIDSI